MIELSEKVIAIWFIGLDDESDFMAALEQETEELFKLTFRFRYYTVEGHPFSGWDEKRWYKAEFRGPKEKALETAKKGIRSIEKMVGVEADEVMASSAEEYMEIMKTKSWVHMKMASEEEAEKLGLERKEDEWPNDLEVSST